MSMLVCKVSVEDVTVMIDGEPLRVRRDHPNADQIIYVCKGYNLEKDPEVREDIIETIKDLAEAKNYISQLTEDFEINAQGRVYLKGTTQALPSFLAHKIKDFIDAGLDINPLTKFWKHLLLNPDFSVRAQLFAFLEHNGHPITEEGYFLAYKAVGIKRKYDAETGEEIIEVRYDEDTGERIEEKVSQAMTFKPFHSGSHGMVIKVGEAIKMPREACDSDPEQTCSAGLHVGSMEYVKDFGHGGSVVLEVLVNPRNVVAVPYDYNNTKMRCCEYFPIAITNGENENVYLESDYTAIDKAQLEEDMKQFKQEREDKIAAIEKDLAEKLAVAGNIYL